MKVTLTSVRILTYFLTATNQPTVTQPYQRVQGITNSGHSLQSYLRKGMSSYKEKTSIKSRNHQNQTLRHKS